MDRFRFVVSSVLGFVLEVVLAACGSTASATGSLKISVSGLPTGTNASVLVTGASYSKTVTSTPPLTGLAPGTYTVAPQDVTLRRNVLGGTAGPASVTVAGNASVSDAVTYAVQPGDLWIAASAGGSAAAGSVTQFLGASLSGVPQSGTSITGLSQPGGLAFDPPPYDLPLSH